MSRSQTQAAQRHQINAMVDDDLKALAQAIATQRGISFSAAIEESLERWVADQKESFLERQAEIMAKLERLDRKPR